MEDIMWDAFLECICLLPLEKSCDSPGIDEFILLCNSTWQYPSFSMLLLDSPPKSGSRKNSVHLNICWFLVSCPVGEMVKPLWCNYAGCNDETHLNQISNDPNQVFLWKWKVQCKCPASKSPGHFTVYTHTMFFFSLSWKHPPLHIHWLICSCE